MENYSKGHICHCLSRLSTLRHNLPATISGERRKSGPEFVEEVLGLAHGLLRLGLRPGDVVAIAALNSELYLEWLLAIAFVGGIAAPLNYRWSFEEAMSAMDEVKPVMLVTDKSCKLWSSKLQNHNYLPCLRWHVSLDSSSSSNISTTTNALSTETIMRKQPVKDFSSMNYSWAPQGSVIICFTSGTTGRPKGVVISHSALITQSLAKIAIVRYSEDDVYLHTAPLCHIGGLSTAFAMLMIGACHVFIPKFEAKSALEAIQSYGVTALITVPAIMADLIYSARVKETGKGIECVKKILNGGGGLSLKLTKQAVSFFPKAKIFSAYGMTETCSTLTFMTLHDPKAPEIPNLPLGRTNQPHGICVGKPAPHVEIKISIMDNGSSNFGKILTRGPHVMLGYWGRSQSSSKAEEGDWLDTGDIGFVDDIGNLWLMGRDKGRIKTGGENVYPEEVEAILSQHPGVVGVVVVGIPDIRLTEMVVACLQLKRDWQWTNKTSGQQSIPKENQLLYPQILRLYCKEKNLAGFKIPKKFILWNKPFPVTTTGKVIREKIQREIVSQQQPLHSHL
ncbi:hypothetical protein UlMin_019093 [Ulmus minor]